MAVLSRFENNLIKQKKLPIKNMSSFECDPEGTRTLDLLRDRQAF
jgi:hypothetical protein